MNSWGDAAFNPRSIALVGASAKPGKLGHILMRNLLEGYPGELYPINPGETEIMGHRTYQRVQDVPQQIDLVVIALPTELCVEAMRDCANVGAQVNPACDRGQFCNRHHQPEGGLRKD